MSRACGVLLLLALVACGTAQPRILLPTTDGTISRTASDLLAEHPLPAGQNILSVQLWRTEALSCHFVQIRDREVPHVHADHELVVTLVRGAGELRVRDAPYRMAEGDGATIPRGTPHHFVNTGSTPAAAIVTFAPAFDGRDNIPTD
jgi:mannose-6-phosphate isomerase-like protein (cupin superfamily)